MEVELIVLVGLFFTAVAAGAIDVLAGGGGLLTVPALLWAGIPPVQTLATNKCQAVFGSGSATLHFYRSKAFKWREMRIPFFMTLLGSVLGTLAVRMVNSEFLEDLIPWGMIAIATYVAFSKPPMDNAHPPKMQPFLFGTVVGLSIGFYDGFFGPGTGTFFAMAFVLIQGYSLQNATVRAKVLNFSSNIASFITFAIAGDIIWVIGLSMAVGTFIGARIGSALVLSPDGVKWIRPVIVVMSIAMATKLLLT